jgi:hypothetical protein
MVYGEKDFTRNLLLNLKPRSTSNLTQNSTFTDTAKNMTHHTSDKAFLISVIYETTHILENLQEPYGLLSFGCITIWQRGTYTPEAAHFNKLLASTPQRYMASHFTYREYMTHKEVK